MSDENLIRKKRKERNISQAKLAKLLNIKQYRLSKWELNENEIPKNMLEKILECLDNLSEKEIDTLKKKKVRKFKNKSKIEIFTESEARERTNILLGNKTKREQYPKFLKNMEKQFPSNGKKVIDLFSGCGGFSLGFKLAGYDIVGHVELDPTLCEIYHANFPESRNLGNNVKDVLEANVLTWKKEIGDIDVLIGGPPCQGFSLAGKRNRYDPRNELFLDFVRIASILQPKIILMENVRLLTSMKTADNKIFPEIISEEFEAAGYEIIYKIVNMQDFGVPQFRERVFFLGARNDLKKKPLTFPASLYRPPSQKSMLNDTRPYRTFKTACSGLESLESGERSPVDPWHWAVTHPPHVIEWLKDVPEGESAHNNEDPRLRPPSGYNTTYKRIKWNEPCSTISTNFSMISGSRNVHPTNTRSLTIREAMRCQTFPDSFIFFGKLGDIRKAIGNALPPFFAKKFAVHIYKIFFKEN